MQVKEQQLELDMEQQIVAKSRKEYVKAVYCHTAYLPGYEAQAGIKIAVGNINNLRYVDDTTLMAESEEELKNFLIKVRG